ncbi:MAG TPA: hypothetical protein DEA08_22155 [Planctomycetes bacterium]|nr:hypothetical protein [Planctomycetota bacterium]
MTRGVTRPRFQELVSSLREEQAFLSKYPHPALLLEPVGSSSQEMINTPPEPLPNLDRTDLGATIADVLVAPKTFTGPSGLVHPEARVVWVAKSDRNPFAGMITLGRARNNDLVLSHRSVSKMHAIFYRRERGWLIEDRNSTNGTFIEGVRLPPNQGRELNDGSTVRIADAVSARFFEPQSFWHFCQLVRGTE